MSQPPESEHQELRAALAKVPLEEPPAELVRRWHAKLAADFAERGISAERAITAAGR